jgi:hypothetical protein
VFTWIIKTGSDHGWVLHVRARSLFSQDFSKAVFTVVGEEASLEACSALCDADEMCKGIYIFPYRTSTKCRGLFDIGTAAGKESNADDLSYAKPEVTTTATSTFTTTATLTATSTPTSTGTLGDQACVSHTPRFEPLFLHASRENVLVRLRARIALPLSLSSRTCALSLAKAYIDLAHVGALAGQPLAICYFLSHSLAPFLSVPLTSRDR